MVSKEIIVVLLILAIVFSLVSIAITLSINVSEKPRILGGSDTGRGNIGIGVEVPSEGENEGV